MDRARRTLPAARVAALAAVLAACACPPAFAHGDAERPEVTHGDTARELGGPGAARELREEAGVAGAKAAVRTSAARAAAAPAASATASSWCGTPSANDDLASAVNPALPAVKVVYAFPADRPDRFALLAGALQEAAVSVTRFVASQAGGLKTIRFDSGTSCGPAFLDVTWVPLSRPRAGYLDGAGNPLFAEVKAEIESRLATPPGPRNHLVFVDNLLEGATFGQAELRRGADEPGPGNPNNRGGQFAFVWGADGFDADRGKSYELPLLMLHEAAHTLGAVQLSAPHSTGGGHCGDGADVMCYSESDPSDRKITACADTGAALVQFDCNKDDYFNPAPPAGSYLATHWNVYDSAFLGTCGELAAHCGSAPSAPSATEQPQAAAARTRRSRSATLRRLRRGRPIGRSLGRMTVKTVDARAKLSTSRLRLPRGRWRVRLCLQPGTGQATASRAARTAAGARTARARAAAGGRCRTRTVRSNGRRRVKTRGVKLAAPAGSGFLAASADVRPSGRKAKVSRSTRIGPRKPLVLRVG